MHAVDAGWSCPLGLRRLAIGGMVDELRTEQRRQSRRWQWRTGGGGSGGTGGGGNGGGGGGCAGLQCQQIQCPGGGTTSLTGKVFAPNGTLPLYNAIVYVPNARAGRVHRRRHLRSLQRQRLGQIRSSSPPPTPTGSFTLTNVPVGSEHPARHPARQVAPATYDPERAGLRVDAARRQRRRAAEEPHGGRHAEDGDRDRLGRSVRVPAAQDRHRPGRDHRAVDGGVAHPLLHAAHNSPGGIISGNTPDGTMLYGGSGATLLRYDVVMLPCEGGEFDQSAGTANIANYVNAGGRVFTTHYSYDWWHYDGQPVRQGRHELDARSSATTTTTRIQAPLDTLLPEGAGLRAVAGRRRRHAARPTGKLDIAQGRHDITGVNPTYAQAWVNYDFGTAQGGPGVMHLTFNTPLDAPKDDMGVPQYCGRAVYSDFHVTANALVPGAPATQWSFPSACKADDP